MSDRKQLPGKFVWFELETRDPRRAQALYAELFGWRVVPFPMGTSTYEMIYLGDQMIGGYGSPRGDRAQWLACVSVEDVDGAAKATAAAGGKVIDGPADAPGIFRRARIADPQGAELYLFKSARGDAPDASAPVGGWMWNELHTTDPAAALAFYAKVIGFTHRSMDAGAGDQYHVVGRGGVDRGGVTGHLPAGVPPHWLPYVHVDDPDATTARARKMGATIAVAPMDIPGIGRFGVLAEPTGAPLAVMKPAPMEKPMDKPRT